MEVLSARAYWQVAPEGTVPLDLAGAIISNRGPRPRHLVWRFCHHRLRS